jgi:hypothetical protein
VSGYELICWLAFVFTFTLFVGSAVFWGRELGAIGYWYWGIAALLIAIGAVAFYFLLPLAGLP